MRIVCSYLYRRRREIVLFLFFAFVFTGAFLLYRLPVGAALYPTLICAVVGLLALVPGFLRARRKHRLLTELAALPAALMERFPEPRTQDDEDYQQIIGALFRRRSSSRSAPMIC